MEDRILATLILGSYLDTIGFNNGMYEFNFNRGKITSFTDAIYINNMILTDFMYKGGFENVDIKQLNASDDTIMMLYTGNAILKKKVTFNDYRESFNESYKYMANESKRGSGIRTLKSLKNLQKCGDPKIIFKFQSNGGGNGAAMRASVIGIRFRKNLNELIEQSILAGKMTHTHPYGYLGSVAVAYFIKCALDGMIYFKWIRSFLDLYDIIYKKSNVTEEEEEDFNLFFTKLEEFHINIKDLLDDDIPKGYYRINKIDKLLKMKLEPAFNGSNYEKFGSTGLGVVIASLYFLFLSIKPKKSVSYKKGEKYNVMGLTMKDMEIDWRFLFINSSLNFGDNDTIGIICGNLYGALVGFKNLPKINFKNLEFYQELSILAKKINKF
tara:strand:+ start:1150 stop:2298 length:1149 start_codon:yes stop_codon:yes gene_type:complete